MGHFYNAHVPLDLSKGNAIPLMNNDVLRGVRYMLSINNAKMVEIIKLDDFEVAVSAMDAYVIEKANRATRSARTK